MYFIISVVLQFVIAWKQVVFTFYDYYTKQLYEIRSFLAAIVALIYFSRWNLLLSQQPSKTSPPHHLVFDFFPVMIFFPFSKFSFVLICSCYPLCPISSFSIWIGSPAADLSVTKISTCFLCFLPEPKPAKSGILQRFRLFCC